MYMSSCVMLMLLNDAIMIHLHLTSSYLHSTGEVAKLFVDAGIICIASLISPYRKDRDACRKLLEEGEFIEVNIF